MRPISNGRRALRVLGITLAGIAAAALLLITLLLLPGVRGRLLPAVVARAVDAVPGTLDVGTMRWSRLGYLEFERVVWTAEGDTLAVADRVAADVELRALLRGDVHVRRAEVAVAQADVPRLRSFLAALPPSAPKERGDGPASTSVPSVVVDHFEVEARRVTVTADAPTSAAGLAGSLDLRNLARPRVHFTRVEADHPAANLRLGPGTLNIDVAERRADGAVTGRWGDDWSFALTAESPAEGTLALALTEGGDAPNRGRLDVHATWPHADTDSLRLEAQLVSPPAGRLATIPGWEALGTGVAPAEQLRISLTGDVAPAGVSVVHVDLGPFAGIDTGRATVRLESGAVRVSALEVRGDGLRVSADAALIGDAQTVRAQAEIDGTNWLAPWVGAPPDSVQVTLTAEASGSAGALEGHLRAQGGVRLGTTTIDSVRVAVEGGLSDLQLSFDARARINDVWVAGRGRPAGAEPLTLRVEPWRVTRRPPTEQATPSSDAAATITWDGTELVAKGVRVLGEMGDVRADARWNASDGVTFAADAAWPEAPPLLLDLMFADAEGADAPRTADVAARWSTGAGAFVRAEGAASPDAWNVEADVGLPEPGTFVALFPAGMATEGLGRAEGRLHAEGAGANVDASFRLTGDGWLDDLVLRAGVRDSSVVLDTLALDLFGLRAAASGRGPRDDWHGALTLDGPDLDRVRAVLPALPPGLTAGAAADVRVSGALTAPNVSIRASASAADSAWSVPGVLAEIDLEAGTFTGGRLWSADTVRVGGTAIERFALQARPAPGADPGGPAAVAASFEAQSDSLTALAVVRVAPGDSIAPWTAAVDSFTARWAERDLTSVAPFFVRWQMEPAAWELDGLRLRGALGEIEAGGAGDPSALEFLAAFDLRELPRPAALDVPPGGWPEFLRGRITAARRDSLAVDVAAGGLSIGPLKNAEAQIEGAIGSAGTLLLARFTDGESTPIRAEGNASHRIDLLTGTVTPGDGIATGRLEFEAAPLPARLGDPAAIERFLAGTETDAARLDGVADVVYSPDAVRAEVRADVTFPDEPRLAGRLIRLAASLGGGAPRDDRASRDDRATRDPAPRDSASAPAGGGPASANLTGTGLEARVLWISRADSLAAIDVAAPGLFVSPTDGTVTEGDSLHVRADLEGFRLDELDPLLPPGTHVTGTLRGEITAAGPREEMELDGWLEAIELVASTPEGNRARAGGRLKFSGTTAAPQVDGDLVVNRANLVIPAPPRVLHPTSGQALLWADRPDSTAPVVAAPATNAVAEAVHLGINVAIPGACRLRGRGLDVELAGDLSLVLRQGRPRVEGVLQTIRGTLRFVGTRFTVQRGTVTFFGTEVIDPNLDIELTNRKGDLLAIVNVTGRASAPEIRLTSEPAMEEADILANLLFGRPSDDLDREQTGFLESQATAALQMFAAPGLERALGSSLGLDVVRLTEREGSEDQLSVVVGKYLSPRALLSYDQALDRGDDFAINLEYWLTRNLRFETTTSRQTQSGVQLNWTRDY